MIYHQNVQLVEPVDDIAELNVQYGRPVDDIAGLQI